MVVRIEGLLCTQVCQLHYPALCSRTDSVQQTIKHGGSSLVYQQKQNFSSMQLQLQLAQTEVKSFLDKP